MARLQQHAVGYKEPSRPAGIVEMYAKATKVCKKHGCHYGTKLFLYGNHAKKRSKIIPVLDSLDYDALSGGAESPFLGLDAS